MAEYGLQVLTELLVLRAQAGQGDAMGLLARAWQDRLFRHARRLTGQEDAASDVLQDAWLDIARGLRRLDDPMAFGPWAYRIVTRRCALLIRQRRRRSEVEREVAIREELTNDAQASAEMAEAVRVALCQLPTAQQAILELRYTEDFGIKQIACALDIAEGTAKSRLFQAREQLRQILDKVTK